ncbi:MAG TPA: hypothetical protein VMJ65_17310 [Solirubrobacteraceae bacterium]|nr:hypothetical protein [Solirubrobacteraceae bacterium]
MIQISEDALRDGCDRARDLFLLNRLRGHREASASFDAVYEALGIETEMRETLESVLGELVPIKGVPLVEATAVASMAAGVLVGVLIADSTLPADELDLPVVEDPA